MEGCFRFQWGEGVVFQMWSGFIFKWEGCPMRGIDFDMGVFEKNRWMRGAATHTRTHTKENPSVK